MADKSSDSAATGVARWNSSKSQNDRRSATRRSGTPAPKESQGALWLLALAVVLVVVAIAACVPWSSTLGWGTEFAGGSRYTYTASDADATDEVGEAIKRRLGIASVTGVQIKTNDDAFVLEVPSRYDAETISKMASMTGKLELVRLDCISDADAIAKIEAGSTPVLEAGTYTTLFDSQAISNPEVYAYLTTATDNSSTSYAIAYGLSVRLDDAAEDAFEKATSELASISGQIVIVLDGVVVCAPTVSEEITGDTISLPLGYTQQEATALACALAAGELPCDLTLDSIETIEATASVPTLAVPAVIALVVIAGVLFVWGRLTGLILVVPVLISAIYELGILALFSRLYLFAPSVVGFALAGVSCAVTLCICVVEAHALRSAVASGRTPRDAALSLVLPRLKPYALVAASLCVVFLFQLVGFDKVTVFGSAAFVWVAQALACALVVPLVLVPVLKLCAAGGMRTNPGAWGLAVPKSRE